MESVCLFLQYTFIEFLSMCTVLGCGVPIWKTHSSFLQDAHILGRDLAGVTGVWCRAAESSVLGAHDTRAQAGSRAGVVGLCTGEGRASPGGWKVLGTGTAQEKR